MKVALVKAPATYADWYRRPVLGLGYLCSYLKAHDFECRIFDSYFYAWSERQLLRYIKEYNPDVIGLTAMTHEINQAAHIAGDLKEDLAVPVVIGGCHVTALPERTLDEFPVFDYGICGEGERPCLELMQYLQGTATSDPGSIEGLAYREGSRIHVNPRASFLSREEIDQLPIPAFNDYYGDDPRALESKDSCYAIISSRGCPYNCAFCMRALGRKLRPRSPDRVWEEIRHAITHWGAHTFDFYDDIMLRGDEDTKDLLDLMITNGFAERARWCGMIRVNLVNSGIIALAKKAGCFRLGLGIESGDDDVLEAVGKGISVAQARRAVGIIKDAGLAVDAYFILGHPNETEETVRKTVDLAVDLNSDTIAIGLMVPYPGTRIYEMALVGTGGYRLLTMDWSQYDKYGGKALEVRGMPYEKLLKWQRRAYIRFYLENLRPLELCKYVWMRRRAVGFFIKRQIGRSAPHL